MTNVKLLVVEDDALTRRFVERAVEEWGHEVVAFSDNADDAVTKAETLQPDVVLMDIELSGGGDGITAARRIQEKRRVPVIYMTSHADDKTLQRAKITDPFGYLLKPVEGKSLAVAIELSVSRHRAELERERLLAELRDTSAVVNILGRFLTICKQCQRIRDDKGNWIETEPALRNYLKSIAKSVCPNCSGKG